LIAVVGGGLGSPPFRLAPLRIGGHVARAPHAVGTEAEALERPLEAAALLRVARVGLPPHLFPAVEERAGLLGRPAERVEHVGATTVHRIAQMREREVGSVAGIGQILLRPLHLLASGGFGSGIGRPFTPLASRRAPGADGILLWLLATTGLRRASVTRLSGLLARLGSGFCSGLPTGLVLIGGLLGLARVFALPLALGIGLGIGLGLPVMAAVAILICWCVCHHQSVSGEDPQSITAQSTPETVIFGPNLIAIGNNELETIKEESEVASATTSFQTYSQITTEMNGRVFSFKESTGEMQAPAETETIVTTEESGSKEEYQQLP